MIHTILMAALAISSVNGHMALSYPAPFRASNNPHAKNVDYSMTTPLSGAAQFPCKGYSSDMADTTGAGAPVATWTAGQKYNFTVTGGAPHGGGSCQIALSYDSKTFSTIHSYIGSCPLSSGQNFDFTLPSDAKTGPAMFAWVWYNKVGNREIYMNCASVNIAAGTGAKPAVAFSSRPSLFLANLGNGCTTVEGKDAVFPDPGPDADVTTKLTTTDDKGSFTGTCAPVGGVGGQAAAAAGSPVSGSGPKPGASLGSTATAAAPITSGTGTANSSLQVSTSGVCGENKQTCVGSKFGKCCSKFGYCGDTPLHCGTGCVSGFGQCGDFLNSTEVMTSSASPARRLIRVRRPLW
ncbi:uncharacterized protein BP5553_04542 [Venustampulla echinocandica]|uniref:Chitin-binding type-1 domain-containing protein n=1 Tax=Venustampulla echinocandica TaxID=2656787 RepID=A0A370TNL1_9HELO|nr:uncharacterized protein BP5553_04542 [Venustampulla echinocandica]RDL37109.1 hypothetical protein BP5553_04542 [Venustampulla echinocandica]